MSDFAPIADHGVIGDLRTCALVSVDATIDWFCAGRFDSPSVFGSLLDPDAGSWRAWVVDGHTRTAQFYFPDSAILVTRFLTEDGVAEVHDFFPLVQAREPHHHQRIIRRVVAVRGVGLWAGIDVDPKLLTGRQVCEGLLARGVLAKDTHGSTVRLAPPIVVTREELDLAVDALQDVLAAQTLA